jgi:hypothetical protein
MHNEDLVLHALNNLADETSEIRTETMKQSIALSRIEGALLSHKGFCNVTHQNLDEKLESILTFKNKVNQEKLDDLVKKVDKIDSLKEHIYKSIAILPIPIIVAVLSSFLLKGCH